MEVVSPLEHTLPVVALAPDSRVKQEVAPLLLLHPCHPRVQDVADCVAVCKAKVPVHRSHHITHIPPRPVRRATCSRPSLCAMVYKALALVHQGALTPWSRAMRAIVAIASVQGTLQAAELAPQVAVVGVPARTPRRTV